MTKPRLALSLLMALLALAIATPASAQTYLWGLTTDNTLVRFERSAPGTILATRPITGLPAGEHLIGIEVDHFQGFFVGVSNAAHVYKLDRLTGAATAFAQDPKYPAFPIEGNAFGMTEHYAGDLQLVSDTGNRVNLIGVTYGVLALPAFVPGTHHFVAMAWYDYELPGGPLHALIDSATDELWQNVYPGSSYGDETEPGTLALVGSLGVDTTDAAGMDLDWHDGALLAALTVGGVPGLYTIDKPTGHATLIGAIGSAPITSLAADRVTDPTITSVTPYIPVVSNLFGYREAAATIELSVARAGDPLVPVDYLVTTFDNTVATQATPGVDYVAHSETLHFEPGEMKKSLFISLLDDSLREPVEAFGLRFTENGPNGYDRSFSIYILDDDNQPPALTVTSPSFPITVSTPTITITGTWTDEDQGVIVRMSTRQVHAPTFSAPAGSNPWSITVPLVSGLNTYYVSATDIHGSGSTAVALQIYRTNLVDQSYVFAEGSTGGFFDTDLLLANPNFAEVPVTIDFMREDGVVIPHALTLPPAQRVTLKVDTIPGLEATATAAVVHTSTYPIVAERTMRWDKSGYGASTEKAMSGYSTTWLFAEGSQGWFSTFLLLLNPQATNNDVTIRFLREGGLPPVTRTYTMLPHQRLTIDAGTVPDVVNQSFGIEVTFAQPGAAERSMYFGRNPLWTGGHESAGAPAAATDWFLAEGATGPFFETFLLLANPSSESAEVTITYLPNTSVPVTKTKQIPANGRLTINIETEDPALTNVAVGAHVTSTKPIIVERSQYWPYTPDQWYEAHNSFGQTAAARHWGLAEGRIGGPEAYQTYILIANASTTLYATCDVRFLREGLPPVTKQFVVSPTGRFNLRVDSDTVPEIPEGNFGADVSCDIPVVVERSMYSDAIGQIWAAGTNAAATRLP